MTHPSIPGQGEAKPKSKTFDARDVGTITTGIVLHPDGFRNVPELFEHVMGHPVWTHEMPSLRIAVRERVLEFYPDFPTDEPDDYKALAETLVARYPDGIRLPRGDDHRKADLLTTLGQAIEAAKRHREAE